MSNISTKAMGKTILLICLSINFISLKATNPYCDGDTLNCIALNGLNLRDVPGGKKIASIQLGEMVVVISTWDASTKADTYENIAGRWIKVNYNTQIGYVFDGYLSKMPAPSLLDSSMIEYLERVSTHIGKPIKKTSTCAGDGGGEGAYSVTIQLYQGDDFTAKRIDYGGWEWGHSTIAFDYISFEEIALICKVVFRDTYAKDAFEIPIMNPGREIYIEGTNDSGYDNFTLKRFDIAGRDTEIRVIIDSGY